MTGRNQFPSHRPVSKHPESPSGEPAGFESWRRMAQARPTLAGREMPSWADAAVRLATFLFIVALGWQVSRFEGDAAFSPAPPSAQARSAATAPARTLTPVRPAPVRLLHIDRPLYYGDYVWNDEGVPPGRVTVRVDLSAETISVVRSGREIGRAMILYGTDEQPTPIGTFPILEKDADHESNIYDAAMPYMLRLTRDGVAIHASNVELGRASRGCVGVPRDFAALLFAQARIGDVVTIVRGNPADAPDV